MSDYEYFPSTLLWHEADDAQSLAKQLAFDVAELLARFLSEKKRVSFAVSGGSTPKVFFQLLSEKKLDWSRVDIILVDERWVSQSDPNSNEAMVRRYLLQNEASSAPLLPIKNEAPNPELGLSGCEQLLRELELPIDIVVLGMGEDGHTASLFPDMPNLTEALSSEALLYVVARPESSDFPRISLSARVLASASMVILHITGQSKRNTLAQACQQKNAMNMPIWSIIKQKEINVYWSV